MSHRTHECPAPGCGLQVPNHMFACKRDWYRLPRDLRRAIRDNYLIDPQVHAEAMSDAVEWYHAADEANKV